MKYVFNNIMTNNKIVLAFIAVLVAAGLLALSPSIIGNAQAQMYANDYGYDNNYYQDDNRYSYDKKDSKSSHGDIQKIKCVNSNINVNGIDITQIPQDATALAAANEGEEGTNAANSQNGNVFDKINFDRNLVNICVNVNDNDQLKFEEPFPPIEIAGCEGCFITAIANSPDPAAEAQKLIDQLETGIQITILSRIFTVNSISEACQVLDLAPTRAILDAGVLSVVSQAGLVLGETPLEQQQAIAALQDCVAAEFGFPPD